MSDIEIINNFEAIEKKKKVVFGASGGAIRFLNILEQYNIRPLFLCDSNNAKWGKSVKGIEVISPSSLKELCEKQDIIVIIASVYVKEIYEQLIKIGIKKEYIVSSFSVQIGLRRYVQQYKTMKELACFEEIKNRLFFSEGDPSYEFDDSLDRMRYLRMIDSNNQIVLAFQPPKVGSSSIFESLKDKPEYFILHFHDVQMLVDRNELSIDQWKKALECKAQLGKKVKIITGVREPVSRELSDYFQKLWAYDSMIYDYRIDFLSNMYDWLNKSIKMDPVEKAFNANDYWRGNRKYGLEFDWYNCELKKFFDIDVYQESFDKERGYSIYSNKYAEVFVYQLEKLNDLVEPICQFLGESEFELIRANDGAAKRYWKLYHETQEAVKFPTDYLDFYYKYNDGFDHFYSKKDQERFLKKYQ